MTNLIILIRNMFSNNRELPDRHVARRALRFPFPLSVTARSTIRQTEVNRIQLPLIYTEPLIIREDTKLKAVIVTTEDTSSVFEEHIHVNKATFKPSWLANAPHENYTFNGVSTLTDGLQGNQNYNTGRWLGFLKDMDLTIDLQKVDTCLFGIADCQRLKKEQP